MHILLVIEIWIAFGGIIRRTFSLNSVFVKKSSHFLALRIEIKQFGIAVHYVVLFYFLLC